jgi:hypothetical protein
VYATSQDYTHFPLDVVPTSDISGVDSCRFVSIGADNEKVFLHLNRDITGDSDLQDFCADFTNPNHIYATEEEAEEAVSHFNGRFGELFLNKPSGRLVVFTAQGQNFNFRYCIEERRRLGEKAFALKQGQSFTIDGFLVDIDGRLTADCGLAPAYIPTRFIASDCMIGFKRTIRFEELSGRGQVSETLIFGSDNQSSTASGTNITTGCSVDINTSVTVR